MRQMQLHNPLALTCALIVLAFAPPTLLTAQAQPASRITWAPERPVQGTLFRVRLAGAPEGVKVTASAAGEPLHFKQRDSVWEAIAAAPLDRGAHVDVKVQVDDGGAVDSVFARIPIDKGVYALEKLTVAPRFGAPPDSALQARMDRERELALAVSRASHNTPRLWEDVVKPRDSRITSSFGSGREFNGRVQSRHTGTDYAAARTGEPTAPA